MKKIMFNDRYGLTEAVLSGRKTQTRRIIPIDLYNACDWSEKNPMFEDSNGDWHPFYESKYVYKVGEVVAVAQSYKVAGVKDVPSPIEGVFYEAHHLKGWNNKMFVCADLMPHRIRITNVRVERLQDISDEDCEKEGIRNYTDHKRGYQVFWFFDMDESGEFSYESTQEAYAALIDRIAGKGVWQSNPFVFVYDFELVK